MFILTTTSPLILYLLKDDIYRTLANESGDKRLQSILVSSPFFFLFQTQHRVGVFRDLDRLKNAMGTPLTVNKVMKMMHSDVSFFWPDINSSQDRKKLYISVLIEVSRGTRNLYTDIFLFVFACRFFRVLCDIG